ncbi:MAG TPA: assimilatory sulfite reductase (NADPH) flavoprotein subunit [Gammaproteobacteria bacterium]|nr:assimilatory sulfite reductase (NADPH) flavoprotein subunit [Gammaproteobacteria bacterium]
MSTAVLLDTALTAPRRDLRSRLEQALDGCSEEDLIWASGFLAGLSARGQRRQTEAGAPARAAEAPRTVPTLTILYASQTGNGKGVAQRALDAATAQGIAARLVNLADFNPRQVKQERAVLLVVSTHGDGDPPDDALALHRLLHGAQAPRLERLSFAVIALGDSSYPHFCKTGRDFDARLEALGAKRLAPRVDCDLDFHTAADGAVAQLLAAVAPGEAAAPARITLVERTPREAASEAADPVREILATASVLTNQRLSGRHSTKDVRHLEFGLDTGEFAYEPGDSVLVTATNAPALVDELLATTGWSATETVRLGETSLTLREALGSRLELTLLARPTLAALAARSDHGPLHDALAGDGEALQSYVRERQLVDVLRESGARLTAQEFVALARPLGQRAYSIASSRLAAPGELHLTVAVVDGRYDGRPRPGCASGFLAARAVGEELQLKLERNPAFRLPREDDAPIVMIGPGTGVAPFRAFIEERTARGARGRSWLFFGERTQREDFLYQLEWQRHLRQGSLTRLDVAFSRDTAHKHYVQDRLRERAQDVYAWLEEGAYIYVCGDAQRMAKDVHQALIDLIARSSGREAAAAEDHLFELKRQGRYQRDVY